MPSCPVRLRLYATIRDDQNTLLQTEDVVQCDFPIRSLPMHISAELLRTLWLEILGGVIAAGVVAVLVYLWTRAHRLASRTHRVLVYVSSGSTCRDPMAKVITEQILASRKLKHPIDIYAVGLAPTDKEASFGAQEIIKEMYHHDFLKNHKPAPVTAKLVNKANLILVMDKKLFDATESTLPRSKTYMLKPFFGLDGDITDPYHEHGERDPATLERYRACAAELKEILSQHIDKLLRALGAL
jgi:protein-tyrosine-phosphatase